MLSCDAYWPASAVPARGNGDFMPSDVVGNLRRKAFRAGERCAQIHLMPRGEFRSGQLESYVVQSAG